MNANLISRQVLSRGQAQEEDVSYIYSCFEKDHFYAWITLALIFLPGWNMLLYILGKLETRQAKLVAMLCSPLIVASYPVVLVLCKVFSIFYPGKEFKRWCSLLSDIEGSYEAAPQLCLQTFILSKPKFNQNSIELSLRLDYILTP